MTELDRVNALLDARTAALARRGLAETGLADRRSYLVCASVRERFGLALGQVASVLPGRPCTPLPGAPAALRGIVALSGLIVSVIDLGTALGMPEHDDADTSTGHLVRLRSQEPPVALAVERVLGIAEVAGASVGAADPDAHRPSSLGVDAISGYAAPGSGREAGFDEGFAVVDLPRLLRRFLP